MNVRAVVPGRLVGCALEVHRIAFLASILLLMAAPAYPSSASATAGTVRIQETEASEEPGSAPSRGRPLHFEIVHLIVNAVEPGVYEVAQVVQLRNASDSPWMDGTRLEDGRRIGAVIPLPPAAREGSVQPLPGPDGGLDPTSTVIQQDRNRIVDTRPVPPGVKQIAVTYELVVAGPQGVDVSLTVPYPTQAIDLLVGGTAADRVEVTGSDLESLPAETIRDTEFAHWTSNSLTPGESVSFTLAPKRSLIDPATWALVGLAVALLAAFAYAWHGGPRPRTRGPGRPELLESAARLDVAHRRGRIDDDEYYDRRAAILERLVAHERDRVDEAPAGEAAP